jgi:hypothetical protein
MMNGNYLLTIDCKVALVTSGKTIAGIDSSFLLLLLLLVVVLLKQMGS